jgi:TonB-linked SusC/RagA family outer membrane protein
LDLNDSRNQIRIQERSDNLSRFSSAIGSIFLNAKIFDGLSFRSQFGLNTSLLLQDNERRAFAETGGRFVNPINFVDKQRQTISQTIFTNTLAFDKNYGKHSVNASAVLEQTKINFESALLSDNNEVSPNIPEVFSPNARSLSFSVPENLNSILFLAGYEFDNRYSISGSGRRDTSSRFFSPENSSQWFFSGAFGYDISNESWFDLDFINSFKFRGSYGETGNNRTGNVVNQFLPTLGLNLPAVLNNETVPGISPNNAANADLRWETQIKQNYGFSSGFLYDQIQFSVDYFKNRSEDLLIPVELPSSAGIPGNSQTGSTVIRNVGIVDVEGLEMTLGYNDYKGEFKWNLWANVTRAEATVGRLGLTGEPIERARLNPPFASALNRLAVGEAPFHFFGLVAEGVFSTQAEIDEALPNNSTLAVPVQPGDVRYRDINGDGLIDLGDRAVIGNPNPDFTYALNLRAEYRGWDFDVLFNGVQGVDILNSNVFYLEGLDNGLNYGTQVLRRWQNPGDITDIPRFRFGSNINNEISSRYIEDGSFLRLRNVTVGYTFPNSTINKSGNGFLKKFRIYAQGQNLLTFTNYSGLDPEVAPFYNAMGLVDGLGIDRSAQPRPLTVVTGIQLEF